MANNLEITFPYSPPRYIFITVSEMKNVENIQIIAPSFELASLFQFFIFLLCINSWTCMCTDFDTWTLVSNCLKKHDG